MITALFFAATLVQPAVFANETIIEELRLMRPQQVALLVEVAAQCAASMAEVQRVDGCGVAVRRAHLQLQSFKKTTEVLRMMRKNLFGLEPHAAKSETLKEFKSHVETHQDCTVVLEASLQTYYAGGGP